MTQAQSLRGSPVPAIPLPRITFRVWLARIQAALLADPAPRRHKPSHRAVAREAFIEDAAMAREMYRL
ncbi:hypothetical protein [Mycolicibacterium bacteremicum]|uniref:hypothetical protein n=1 Tax=Mycolicibacterium bacteremicum TaxID=564198 RepID=UPI0026E9FFFC|nr:hypothetical protein [Mycolicibacterium bacteremicum]